MSNVIEDLKWELESINKNITIAIMGCFVNGILEVEYADIGIYGTYNNYVRIYKKGKFIKIIKGNEIKKEILLLIKKYDN